MDLDPINNAQISIMCDIARSSGLHLNADKRVELDRLIADGLVEAAEEPGETLAAQYQLTEKGQKLLDARGVGVNES